MKPWNNNAKYCRRWHAEAQRDGLIALTEKEFTNLQGSIKALIEHETAGPLLRLKGESEVALGCMTEDGPVRMKYDRLCVGPDLFDVKVTADASEEFWMSYGKRPGHAEKMGYHIQVGCGLMVHKAVRSMEVDGTSYEQIYDFMEPKTGFLFLCVENTPPHAVNVFRADEDFIEAGKRAFMRHLKTFHECNTTGIWRSFSSSIKELGISDYAKEL